MLRITPHPALAAHVTARRGPLDFAPPIPPYKPDATWKHVAETFTTRGYLYNRVKNEEPVHRAVRW